MAKLTDYDYDDRVSCCSCRHCWNGWNQVPFLTRLRWRLAYVWRVTIIKRQDW